MNLSSQLAVKNLSEELSSGNVIRFKNAISLGETQIIPGDIVFVLSSKKNGHIVNQEVFMCGTKKNIQFDDRDWFNYNASYVDSSEFVLLFGYFYDIV